MKRTLGNLDIEVMRCDITNQGDVDAVVNAANAELKTGGGVAGAIHREAGPGLEAETRPLAPISPGQAVITDGHQLPNSHIIHCLGPEYGMDEPGEVACRLLSERPWASGRVRSIVGRLSGDIDRRVRVSGRGGREGSAQNRRRGGEDAFFGDPGAIRALGRERLRRPRSRYPRARRIVCGPSRTRAGAEAIPHRQRAHSRPVTTHARRA